MMKKKVGRHTELRYNHFHDKDGKFASASSLSKRYSNGGAKPVDKSNGSDIIDSENQPPKYDTSILNSSNIEISNHAVERAAERGITKADIIDAIDNPLAEKSVKLDSNGRPSFQRIGESATTAINPENRKLTSTWKTHKKLKLKLKGK